MAKICDSCGKTLSWKDNWIEIAENVVVCAQCKPYYSVNDRTVSDDDKLAFLKDKTACENKSEAFIKATQQTIKSIERKNNPSLYDDNTQEFSYKIPIVTTDFITGKTILEMKGPVSACVVFGAGAIKSWASNFSAFFGSKSQGFSRKTDETRYEAEKILIENAINLGANAVIDVHYSISNYYADLTGILVTGTAVIISD